MARMGGRKEGGEAERQRGGKGTWEERKKRKERTGDVRRTVEKKEQEEEDVPRELRPEGDT